MGKDEVTASKFLSLLLRHDPGAIGLELTLEGWAKVSELVEKSQNYRTVLTRELIERVVVGNEKQRFALSPDKEWIRANQGHSIAVELDLEVRNPPEVLFHGTASRFMDSILEIGLVKGKRQHVHLSVDPETAKRVGSRHGKAVVLLVASGQMMRDGLRFYLSENGVWLTEHVPPKYLTSA